ncbi:MAG: hypothetical protein ACT4PG_02110 [Panacagrimonas sp.]
MNRIGIASLTALAALALAACGGDDNQQRGPQTTTEIAMEEIDQNTSETSGPILLNDLEISDADTNETDAPSPI